MDRFIYIVLLSAIFLIVGCSRADTVEVSGTVRWEGKAIQNGDVIFESTDPHVPAAAGKILEGRYVFRCKPGNKRVEIRSYRLTGRKTSQNNPEGAMYIPERYNVKSEVMANVTFDGKNTFDFDLNP